MSKRRAKGEGKLQKTASGKWRKIKRVSGKWLSTASYRTRAEAARAPFLGERNSQSPSRERQTLGDFISHILYGVRSTEVAPGTWVTEDSVFRSVIQKWPGSEMPIDQLTEDDILGFQMEIAKRVTPASASRYLQVLQVYLNRAKRKDLAGAIRLPKKQETEKRLLTPAEIPQFLELLDGRLRIAGLLCLHGLRRGEACGVKHEDFDGEGITIKRQVQEVLGRLHIRETTKSRKHRWVPIMNEELLAAIAEKKEGFVLKTERGKPYRPHNFGRDLRAALKGSPFEGITSHDLRSSFGMLLLESGADVRTAAEILGHSPEMLVRVYTRSRKELKTEAVKAAFGRISVPKEGKIEGKPDRQLA